MIFCFLYFQGAEKSDASTLPERPSEPLCAVIYTYTHMHTHVFFTNPFCVQVRYWHIVQFLPLQFYVKTGNCKFGVNCKFHHPKDIQILSGEENGNSEQTLIAKTEERIGDFKLVKPPVSFSPALMHNSKGLPIRPVIYWVTLVLFIYIRNNVID